MYIIDERTENNHIITCYGPDGIFYMENPFLSCVDELGSFSGMFYERYWIAIQSFFSERIADGTVPVKHRSSKIPTPDFISVMDMNEKRIRVKYESNCTYRAEIVVSAEIEVGTNLGEERYTETFTEWFTLTVLFEVSPDTNYYQVMSITQYDPDVLMHGGLDDYFIPVIKKDDYDKVAECIIRRYWSDALSKPTVIDGIELARRMGLAINPCKLSPDNSVFARLVCYEADTVIYDDVTDEPVIFHCDGNTILVDDEVNNTPQKYNDSIVHECIHAAIHKHFFALQRAYKSDISWLSCEIDPHQEGEDKPLYWMESQAKALLPRVLMPSSTVKKKIEKITDKYKNISDAPVLTEKIITELADFFHVSKTSAKLRLIDLNYRAAQFVLDWVDGHYVPAYSTSDGNIEKNQTYTISVKEAAELFSENDTFRDMMLSGRFAHVEGHICIDAPEYICENKAGKRCLTKYARNHIEKCCLVFNVSTEKYEWKYVDGVLQREVRKVARQLTADVKQLAALDEIGRTLVVLAKNNADILSNLPSTFSPTLDEHMRRTKTTNRLLAEEMGTSERTISVYRSSIKTPTIPLRKVVAMCIVLGLSLSVSEDLIHKAGYVLNNNDDNGILRYLLMQAEKGGNSLAEINRMLIANGLEPLTKEDAA